LSYAENGRGVCFTDLDSELEGVGAADKGSSIGKGEA
jgi:hypothetical protein